MLIIKLQVYTCIYIHMAKYFCSVLTEFLFSGHLFMKCLNIKFQGNLFSGSCADTCGLKDGQTDRWIDCHAEGQRLCECT